MRSAADSATVAHGSVMVGYVSDPAWAMDWIGGSISTRWVQLGGTSQVCEFPTALPATVSFKVDTGLRWRDVQGTTDADLRLEYSGALCYVWGGAIQPSTTAVYYGDIIIEYEVELFELGPYQGSAVEQTRLPNFLNALRDNPKLREEESKFLGEDSTPRRDTKSSLDDYVIAARAEPLTPQQSSLPPPSAAAAAAAAPVGFLAGLRR